MSYIGQGLPADTFQGFVTDSFTGDGSATTFTLSKEPFSEDTLIVVINNVIQKPTTNFTVSGTTLTIVGTAVASGDVIYAIHMGGPLPIGGASELDLNGASDKLILDLDGDTTISADTDDQIDFKTGGTDRMHIASDGDVLISKTSNAYQTTGHEFLDGGRAFHTADGGKALSLVRNSSNGAIMDFYNSSGSEVGSIETGASGIGIKLGGTGTGNLLDYYEEGSWTPTTNTGQGLSISGARFTRIGQFVFLNFYVNLTTITSTSSDTLKITGLPFTSNNQAVYGFGNISYMGATNFNDMAGPLVSPNSTQMYFHQNDGTTATISIAEMNNRTSGGVPLLGGVVYQVPA